MSIIMRENLAEYTLETAREVRKAWELFVTDQENNLEHHYRDKVRAEIQESWRRSRQAGANPNLRAIPMVLTPEEVAERQRQNAPFLEAGRETMTFLSQMLTANTFVATIIDKDSNLLYSYSPDRRDRRQDINALPGAGAQEHVIGTSAANMALHLNKPFQVYWYEFYTACMHYWAGCAAPIHNLCGETLGTLGFAGYQEIAHPRALNLITYAAKSIEEKIKHADELTHYKVLEEFNNYLLRFPESPLLALCPHGRILAFSPALARCAALRSPERLLGRKLSDVADFQVEESRLLTSAAFTEPHESVLLIPQQEKRYPSTVLPIRRNEQTVGMLVIASGLKPSGRRKDVQPLWTATHTFHDLVGCSQVFRQALRLATKAAQYDWPILLVGESGTGKELFAQAIHQASRRAHRPFVSLNCSTIPKDLATAELFGYEEGAFSGARRGGQQGKVELAHHGTLFLDEVEDMPLEIQASFLRFLEEGDIVPLGGQYPRATNVRVIAAMNCDPLEAIAQGKLRLDLFHRLNVFSIVLPPLRERLEDLPLLVRHFLDKEGLSDTEVALDVLTIFRRYSWPGNVRELRNVLIRAATLSATRRIICEDLPPTLLSVTPQAPNNAQLFLPTPAHHGASHSPSSPRRLDRTQILQALQQCRGNKSHAAKLLGIHWVTLHRKMRRYGLTKEF